MPYLYFSGSDNAGSTGVARRENGSWKKWTGGGFTSAGIGGASTGLAGLWGRSASKTTGPTGNDDSNRAGNDDGEEVRGCEAEAVAMKGEVRVFR
jgi:2-methylcitrate dehydratase PrpD